MFSPKVHRHASLPSTMDEARAMAMSGAPEGTVVQADEQTAGRGRFGNTWSSPPGNLYMTLLLRPPVATRHCAQMSFAIALAMAAAMIEIGVPADAVRLKWPNDVLTDGRKIAGILLEVESGQGDAPDFLLAGMGVNVTTAPEGCAAIDDFVSHVDPEKLRDILLTHAGIWYRRWVDGDFAEIRNAWLKLAAGIGAPVTARMADRQLDGIFEGIDDFGNLRLRQADGQVVTVTSGAVHFAK